MQIRNESMLAQHADKTLRLLQRANGLADSSSNQNSIGDALGGNPFSDLLVGGVAKVNNMQQTADGMMEQLITGGDVNQAEVFTSMQKADMSFRLLVQIRNKLLDAYQELNSIHV